MNKIFSRMGYLLLCLVVVFTMLPINAMATDGELNRKLVVKNPGFETEGGEIAEGWGEFKFSAESNDLGVEPEGYSYERSIARAHSGNASLKITDERTNKSAGVYSSGILDIHEGYTYRASAWIYRESGDAPQLNLRFYNMYSMEITSAAVYAEPKTTGEWEKVSVEGIAPVGAVMARIMSCSTQAGKSVFYVDDVEIEELPLLYGWTSSGGVNTSADISVIAGTQYVLGGFDSADTVTAVFYKGGEAFKQVKKAAEDTNLRFYAPHDAENLKITTTGTTANLWFMPAATGTQVPDGSFEIMAKTGTSAWTGQPEQVGKTEIPGGDFEAGDAVIPYNWGASHARAIVEVAESLPGGRGGHALKITGNAIGAGTGMRSMEYEATAGTQYTIDLDYFVDSAVRSADLYIEFWSNLPERYTAAGGTRIKWDGMINACSAKNAWTHMTKTAVAPEGTKYITLILYINRNDSSTGVDIVYLDNIEIRTGDAVLMNDIFEVAVENDTDFKGWSTSNGLTMEKTSAEKYEGNSSLHISGPSGSMGVGSPLLPINPGDIYTAYFHYKTENSNLNIYLEYWKSDDISNSSNRVLEKHHAVSISKSGWSQAVSDTLTAPADAKYVRVTAYFTYSSSASDAYIDNVYLVRSDIAGNYDSMISTELVTDENGGLKLSGGSTISGWIPVISAKEYATIVDVKGPATMKLTYYNVEGNVLTTHTVSSTGNSQQQLVIQKNAPNYAFGARITLETTGTAYFDNVRMYAVTDSISNASFEDVPHLYGGKHAIHWESFGDGVSGIVGGINMPDRALGMKISGNGGIRSSMIRVTPGKAYLAGCKTVSGAVTTRIAFYDANFARLGIGAVAPSGAAYACVEIVVSGQTAVVDAATFTPAVIDVANKHQLLIDDYVIESTTLERTFHQAEKSEALEAMKPVKDGSMPWQTNGAYVYGTVLYDEKEEIFKMWYSTYNPIGSDRVAVLANYATSEDGVNWTLPDLGIGFGSYGTENNIIGNFHNMSVILEYDEAGNPNYTMITYMGSTSYRYFHSTDGIHWTEGSAAIAGSGTYDVVSASPDKTNDRYVSVCKIYLLGDSFRNQWTTYGKGTKWSGRYMTNSIADLIDAQTCYRPESYGMATYERDGVYIGFDWLYRTPGPGANRNWSVGTIEPQLAFSRDLTEQWQRPMKEALVPLGEKGAIDSGIIDTANYPIVVGDELWMYCGVWDGNHGISDRNCNTYIAKWRLDGFASMNGSGTLTTKQLDFDGNALHINSKGTVTVELLDANGNSILGVSDPITTDSVDNIVTWNGKSDLSAINQPVKIKFTTENAEIYAFNFGEGTGVDFEWNGNDCTVTIDAPEEGVIVRAASYNGERLAETVALDAEKLSAVLKGNSVKVFFWKENLQPVRQAIISAKE